MIEIIAQPATEPIPGIPEWKANAALIAAAPDMYEILQEFKRQLEKLPGEDDLSSAYTDTLKILARIEGGK